MISDKDIIQTDGESFLNSKSKEPKQLDLIEIIVLGSYYLFVCFLFLGLFGFFNRFLVYLILVILLVVLFLLRQRINFFKKYLWFFLISLVVVAGFGFLRGFFGGDAYNQWLPAGRDTLLFGQIPGFITGYQYIGMPLLSLLFSATFALCGSFNEWLCLWIPFLFTAATLIVIYQWSQERGLNKRYLFFIPFLFLTNYSVAFWGGWNLLQESLVLFFATASFYYYEKYLTEHQKRSLLFLIISIVLAAASKITGFFLFLLILWLFFKDKKNRSVIFSYFLLFSIPIIFWLVRNYLIFDNPFYPLLNSLFKGRYEQAAENYSIYRAGLAYFNENIWNKIRVIFSSLSYTFPFLLLTLYEFIKRKRYEFLILFLSFALIKEIFLFSPTISNVRYYYFLLGLFLVYALFGLARIKSHLAISGLILLALAGLFLLPITDSTSQFISLFENEFVLLGNFFEAIKNYWYFVLILLAPLAYLASHKPEAKLFLIFVYSLSFLFISFIANKTWLNTWPFVLLSLVILLILVFKNRVRYFKQLAAVLIIIAVFVNSWLIASVYYWHQGGVKLPVPHIWGNSQWLGNVLDKITQPGEKDNFYLLTAAQRGYFNWWTDYQAINFLDMGFWMISSDYRTDLTDEELRQLFKEKKIKYIIKNEKGTEYDDLANQEFNRFFNLISNSDKFKLIANKDNQYFIWQVY